MARINEIGDTEKGQYALGKLRGRKFKKEGFQKANEIGKYAEKAREKASFKTKNVDGHDIDVHSPIKYKNLTDSHANGWHDEMHSKNESKIMNNQIKLTESELHGIIDGAVKSLIREYMPDLMGAGAARGIRQGKLGPYNAAQKIMQRDRWDKDQMAKFQDGFEGRLEDGTNLEEYTDFDKEKMYGKNYDEDFEDLNDSPVNSAVDGSLEDEIAFESKKPIKVNESQLFDIIKESVNIILNEIGDTEKGQYMLGRLQARDGDKSWKGSWEASGARDDAAEKVYNNGGSYDAKYNRMLNAYRRGRNGEDF